MKNVLVLVGSPRKNGNTEALADAFIASVQETGHFVEKVTLAGLRIHGCIGCGACRKTTPGRCVQNDDMQAIYPKLYHADVLVLASPVYYFGITSQLKAALDRFYVSLSGGVSFPIKESAFLAVCGYHKESAADPLLSMYASLVDYYSWKDLGSVIAAGIYDKGEIMGHNALLGASALGKTV
ncbi:flavodoxin family protein [Eubacteriales bacterium OttesenSCG-928-M02]|nr:flavodoxin family protein [Eubacteriales bacterium OttesenSCG-928-M02]